MISDAVATADTSRTRAPADPPAAIAASRGARQAHTGSRRGATAVAMAGADCGRRWEDLSEDCLVNIFQRVWVVDLVVAVPLVCRTWHRASKRPECWQYLNLSVLRFDKRCHFMAIVGPYKVPFPDFLKVLVERSGGSMVQFIFPDHHAWPRDLEFVSDRCFILKILGLPIFSWGEDISILDNACKWKSLEYLYMRDKPEPFIKIVEEISIHCKNLVGLQVCGVFPDDEVAAIGVFLPKLKYLCLIGSRVTKDGLISLLRGCRELEELHVKECVDLDVDDEILQKSSHIKNFEFDDDSDPDLPDFCDVDMFRQYHWCGANKDIRFHPLTYLLSDDEIL